MSKTAISLASGILALALFAAPAVASADYVSGYGYPCRVAYNPPPTTNYIYLYPSPGDHGQVSVTFYSGQYCTGSYVRSVIAYSTGSTVGNYTSNSTVYPEAGLIGLWESLQRAAQAGERVYYAGYTWSITTPYYTSGTQLSYVRFASF